MTNAIAMRGKPPDKNRTVSRSALWLHAPCSPGSKVERKGWMTADELDAIRQAKGGGAWKFI